MSDSSFVQVSNIAFSWVIGGDFSVEYRTSQYYHFCYLPIVLHTKRCRIAFTKHLYVGNRSTRTVHAGGFLIKFSLMPNGLKIQYLLGGTPKPSIWMLLSKRGQTIAQQAKEPFILNRYSVVPSKCHGNWQRAYSLPPSPCVCMSSNSTYMSNPGTCFELQIIHTINDI